VVAGSWLNQPAVELRLSEQPSYGLSPETVVPAFAGKTFFVRTDGGPISRCTGLANAPDTGTGTNQPCGLSNLQEALNAVACGDTVKLRHGDTFTGPGFLVRNKGNCTNNYITIETDDIANLPPGRLNPATSISHLATIKSSTQVATLDTEVGANHYQFIGLEVTDAQTVVGGDTWDIGTNTNRNDRIAMAGWLIDRCFVHAGEISAGNLTPGTPIGRKVGRGILLNVTDATVQYSYIAGYAGYIGATTEKWDSYGVATPSGPGPIHIIDNYIEAQFTNIFTGGGIMESANTAVMSSPTTTSATLTQSANLNINDYIAMRDEACLERPDNERYQVARVNTKAGNVITFTILTGQFSCTPRAPTNGAPAYWNGDHIHDIEIRGNTLMKPDVWGTSMINVGQSNEQTNTGFPNAYKSYVEIKDCRLCSVSGNYMYSGIGTAIAVTVRNQFARFPWVDIQDLTFQSNVINGYENNVFGIQLLDNERPSQPTSRNIQVLNNLIINEKSNPGTSTKFVVITRGDTVIFSHNTILQSGAPMASDASTPTTGFVMKDSILATGASGPFCDHMVIPGNFAECWPAFSFNRNVLVNNQEDRSFDRCQQLSSNGTNNCVADVASVKFLNSTSCLSGVVANCRLDPTSPGHAFADDGTDSGVDVTALTNALNGQTTTSGVVISGQVQVGGSVIRP